MKWVASGGCDIELIRIDGRAVFRVRRHRCLIGYVASVPALEGVLADFELTTADLVEVPSAPTNSASADIRRGHE